MVVRSEKIQSCQISVEMKHRTKSLYKKHVENYVKVKMEHREYFYEISSTVSTYEVVLHHSAGDSENVRELQVWTFNNNAYMTIVTHWTKIELESSLHISIALEFRGHSISRSKLQGGH